MPPMGRSAELAAVLLLITQPCVEGAGCPAGQGRVLGLGSCALCSPGTWSNGSSGNCTKCAPGTWSGIIGATEAAVCVPCLPGHWSSEEGAAWPWACKPCAMGRYGVGEGLSSEDACARCPAGTFSGVSGATAPSTCAMCPRGHYGTESAAQDISTCTPCPAGHWSSQEGAPSPFLCRECPAGTWGAKAGASDESNCTLCPAGKWSELRGASDRAACLDCPTGTWSAQEGASTAAACVPCPAGTWSSTPGAKSPFACTACPAGTAQPRLGMPDEGKCVACLPGTYSSGPGSSECRPCQRGSWSNTTASAWCRACPVGTWTNVVGAVFEQHCRTCRGDLYCLGGSTAHLEIKLSGVNLSGHTRSNRARVASAYVGRIAAACAVDKQAVMDLYGENASVAWTETGLVEAYIRVPMNSSVNAMADRLYTASFKKSMQEVAAKMLGAVPQTFEVNVQPKIFEPLPLPTSASTTLTAAGTTTTQTATTTTTKAATQGRATRRGFPWWAWLLVVAACLGGSLAALLLLPSTRARMHLLLGGRGKARRGAHCPQEDDEEPCLAEDELLAPVAAPRAALPASVQQARVGGAWHFVPQPRMVVAQRSLPTMVTVTSTGLSTHVTGGPVSAHPSARSQQASNPRAEQVRLMGAKR